jgi:ADP-ribosylglycohydrolase
MGASVGDSTGYESAVRLAVSLGGDADTLACIAGGIAQAYYGGVPAAIRDRAVQELDEPLRAILEEFEARFSHPARPKGADLPGMGHDRPPQDQGI